MTKNGKTFIRITNTDIYEEIQKLHKSIESISTNISDCDNRINLTNNKVKEIDRTVLGILGGAGVVLLALIIYVMESTMR
jgi:hypothetical protein